MCPVVAKSEDMEKTFDVSFAGLNKSATLNEIVGTLRCLVALLAISLYLPFRLALQRQPTFKLCRVYSSRVCFVECSI